MEPEEFELSDDDIEAWLDGQRDRTDDDELTRFIIDLRSQADAIAMHPSSRFARELKHVHRCSELPGHIVELDSIIESLMNLR